MAVAQTNVITRNPANYKHTDKLNREQEQELKPALTQFRSKPKMFSNSLAYLELISMRVRIQSLITNC
jgi:hypothetical protein